MLPRPHRLSSSRDIARVYRKGRSARSELFRVTWLPTNRPGSRVAVVTSRKLSTKAVRRNLAKRRVRAIVAGLLPRLVHVDLVVQILPKVIGQAVAKRREEARKVVGELGYQALEQDLMQLLERSRLLRTAEVESRK